MVNSLENIDKSKVYVSRIEGLDDAIETEIGNTLTGAVSTITTSDLTADKVLVSNSNGKVAASSITTTQLEKIPDDTNVVHKTGEETIGGAKTFTGTLYCSKTELTKGVAPETTLYRNFIFTDKFNMGMGVLGNIYDTSKNNTVRLLVNKADSSSDTETAEIGITYPASGNPYTFAPTPDTTTSSSSTRIATTGWVNSTGNNVVHLTGDETITGDKTFTGQTTFNRNDNDVSLINKYTNYTKGTTPSNNQYSGIRMYDSAGTEVSDFYCRITTDNLHLARIVLKDPGTGTANTRIGLYYPADGTPYTEAPTPTSSATGNTSSTEIATCGWVNTLDSNVVHLSGTETITGAKTFIGLTTFNRNNNDVRLINKYTNYTKGTAPSAAQYSGFKIQDSAGTEIGGIYCSINTSNRNSALMVVKDTGTGTSTASLGICYPADGTAYTVAPTPDTSDDSTKIATTAFVKSVLSTSGSGLFTISKAANGYCKFNGGLIVQWFSKAISGVTAVTFPTAFSSATSYSVVGQLDLDSAAPLIIQSRTKTGFNAYRYSGGNYTPLFVAIGY